MLIFKISFKGFKYFGLNKSENVSFLKKYYTKWQVKSRSHSRILFLKCGWGRIKTSKPKIRPGLYMSVHLIRSPSCLQICLLPFTCIKGKLLCFFIYKLWVLDVHKKKKRGETTNTSGFPFEISRPKDTFVCLKEAALVLLCYLVHIHRCVMFRARISGRKRTGSLQKFEVVLGT